MMSKKCTGCSACANVCPKKCIKMQPDEEGFLYPVINDENCSGCGICKSTCPIDLEIEYKSVLPLAYAAFSNDEKVRKESSSGGIFSEIAKLIIERAGVVYGAAYNDSFDVYHLCVDNMNDLTRLRGAKYSESYLGSIFIEILGRLKQGQYVLFSGTSCQIAGLKAFLRKDFANLVCLDFVCHGIPSPMAWKEYIKFQMKEDGQDKGPVAINLRSKNSGWSRYQYSNLFQYADRREYSRKSTESLFMKLFVGDYINRNSCSDCQFKGYNRASDITLGDFWGIWDVAPEMDDNKGTSVVLIQSEKGKLIWNQIRERLTCKEVTLEQASQQNPSILISSKAHEKRKEVLELIRFGKIEECQKLFAQKKVPLIIRLKNKVKRLIYKI